MTYIMVIVIKDNPIGAAEHNTNRKSFKCDLTLNPILFDRNVP